MRKSTIKRGSALVLALAVAGVTMFQISDARKSSAAIVKNSGQAQSTTSLSPVTYNGENMYVAKSSYYDYYSDSQVGTSSTPGTITDAIDKSKNTFGKFNTRLMEVMKYNVPSECPAKYPLYQGRQGVDFPDYANIFSSTNNSVNENSNYWLGANSNQIGAYALQGLVDNKLSYDSSGESYITTSNPNNGKKSYLPYFDKKVLTTNKHTNSELALGGVKENVSFPFRREVADGVTYYEYDSAVDTVRFNANGQLDYFGKNSPEMVKDRLGNGGLFPENVAADSNATNLNYGYGFKIEVPFNMTSDGKIGGKDMVFEFTGDDDVWVFIDGILALDLGGAHPKISGSINFATGQTVVSGVKNPKVALATRNITNYGTTPYTNNALGLVNEPTIYNNYVQNLDDALKAKLRNTGEVHTLTLFYMERGMDVSNMKMKFNLPEPTKFDVANTVSMDTVGETFKEETKKVAKKDSFTYDVLDKNKNTKAAIDMLDGESVSFINEFDAKDVLLTQQTGLKTSDRKLTELYYTSWVVKDANVELGKGTGLVVKDTRRTDKTILFANKDNDNVPVLRAEFTNKPVVGKAVIKSSITDKYSQVNTDYKSKEFSYKVSYADVFAGGSAEKLYNGKYIVKASGAADVEKTAKDGVIMLKAGESATITGVPVFTVVKVKTSLGENEIVSKIKYTSQFKYEKDTLSVTGKVNNIANVMEYVIGDKSETSDKEEDLSKEEIEKIIGEKVPEYSAPEKIEPTTNEEDALDDTAQTGDETNLQTWVILLAFSFVLTVGSAMSIASSRKRF